MESRMMNRVASHVLTTGRALDGELDTASEQTSPTHQAHYAPLTRARFFFHATSELLRTPKAKVCKKNEIVRSAKLPLLTLRQSPPPEPLTRVTSRRHADSRHPCINWPGERGKNVEMCGFFSRSREAKCTCRNRVIRNHRWLSLLRSAAKIDDGCPPVALVDPLLGHLALCGRPDHARRPRTKPGPDLLLCQILE